MSGTNWGVTFCPGRIGERHFVLDELGSDNFVWDELGSDNFVRDELESDILSGTNWGVTFWSDLDKGKKGGSYKIGMDSRVPFLARGSLEYRVGAEGPLESVQEKL